MSMQQGSNIILIGMPGSGKTTIGRKIAQKLERPFIDTDELIEMSQGKPLQSIIDLKGAESFQSIECEVVTSLECHDTVVSTGGSAVYCPEGMEHLSKMGPIFFLDAQPSILMSRLKDMDQRGVVRKKEQSLMELFDERTPLYHLYADHIIDTTGLSEDEICQLIIEKIFTC